MPKRDPRKKGLTISTRSHRRYLQSINKINTYLPVEIMREIFLYSIEVNQANAGDLASVCQYWRSVIITMPSLWSTLKVGIWTERERVATWLQRAYPPKVVIDTERGDQGPSNTPPLLHSRMLLPALPNGMSSLFPHSLLKTWLVSLTFALLIQ
jgi:hypothetical protein